MRNFTEGWAAVSSGHTQGSDTPYPRHRGWAAAGAAATGAATPGGRVTRRRKHTTGRGGYRAADVYRARRGLPGGRLPGRYGAYGARRLPGRAYTRRRGYRGKRGGCSPNVGGYRARGYPRRRGGLPVPGYGGGAIPGRRGGTSPGGAGGYPAARAAHHPRAAATPAGYPGRRRGTVSSACDGFSPHLNPGGAATRRGYPGAGYRAAGEKKFPAGAATPGKPRKGPFARI